MQIQVNGKQINISEALRENVEMRLEDSVQKYSDSPINAIVTFSREGHNFKCHCSVHISTGLTAQADAEATDIHAAYDSSIQKIEKQLRRHKRRLKDHHQKAQDDANMIEMRAQSYVLNYDESNNESGGESEDYFDQDAQPPIVAEMTTQIRQLSVGAAVMHMEFQNLPVLMFQNETHGGLNVVYKREDGSVGWIDPDLSSQEAMAV